MTTTVANTLPYCPECGHYCPTNFIAGDVLYLVCDNVTCGVIVRFTDTGKRMWALVEDEFVELEAEREAENG